MNSSRPLKLSIIGAGIGGLAAAIALRRNGHHVQVFEASPTNTEIGAGVGVHANAVRILKQFGYSRDNLKPVEFEGNISFDAKDGTGITHPWLIPRADEDRDLFCHRDDLHRELKRLALEGEGPPVQLLLDSKVAACDPETGTVTLSSGEVIHADVVIGADGIHSVVRTSILGHSVKPPASGSTCFRCFFDASNLNEFTDLDWLTEGLDGGRSVILKEASFRTFYIYCCRSGTLINFVGFYADPDQDSTAWTRSATLEEIREKFLHFHPKFLRILDLPLSSPILKWQLRALPILPTWIRGRTAILGDAAHATLPLLGQGAAMALEEGAVLGCLLPLGITREDVPARLEAYQTLRKARGEFVSVESALQAAVPAKRGTYATSREMQATIIDYDAIKVAQEYYDAHFGRDSKFEV
ncbi:FAD/NAD(P)-binding domain-containing protein [Mycena galopus ATCC 62051]|nr:FAD/NAD(P)-binding domain-containing protein [Mycena galopus ATCC 62051]